MNKQKAFLILIILFSLLFIALIATGSYLISLKMQPERQFGIATFLFAFAAAFGQIACVALYIRQRVLNQAAKRIVSEPESEKNHV